MTVTDVKKKILLLGAVFCCQASLQAQDDQAQIRQTIERFFEGFSKSDTTIVASVIDKNMTLQTVIEGKEAVRMRPESRQKLMLSIVQPRKEKFEERIISWEIRTDGAYANAWCGYQVYIDSVMHHYGTDNFQLLRADGKWRILSVTDTRRKPAGANEARIVPNIQLDPFTLHMVATTDEWKKEVNALMDQWHKAAATADEKIFFGSMDSTGIYLGTDKTENWNKQDFEKWSKKFFDRDKAWDFKPYDRHIYFSTMGDFAWFDELLDTWMGVCRGSGVLRWEKGQWKILHYNLAVTIANEKIDKFVKINK